MSQVSPSSLSALPRYWPGENGAGAEERPVRRWRVLHACSIAAVGASLAQAQIEIGMRPSLLTPAGWDSSLAASSDPATCLSLIHEWQQVRRWRQQFVAELVDDWADVLHAHCFGAATAGLRGSAPVVYDLVAPIGAGIAPKPGAWLLRSLRVAEQFLLTRADAVVVHSQAMREDALKRGAHADEVFVVPDPVEFIEIDVPGPWPGITIFAPDVFAGPSENAGASSLRVLLQAFATLASEIENARLIIEAGPGVAGIIMAEARDENVSNRIEMIAPSDRVRAMNAAQIVLAGRPAGDEPNPTVIAALAHGRALLAADVPQNREVTPQGRGCLWFRADDARDLAGRAAFLARNPDFRAALGNSGRAHLQATRSPRAVAHNYDEVYRHALQRRHRGNMDMLRKLETVQACF